MKLSECWFPLHVHSRKSIRDGFIREEEFVEEAVRRGYKVCSITDHGNLASSNVLYFSCKKSGIKPMIGMEAYVAEHRDVLVSDKVIPADKKQYDISFHLVLIAINETGFKNLIRINNDAWRHFYKRPMTCMDFIEEHSEGLIATTACEAGELPARLMGKDKKGARRFVRRLEKIFGDNFYVELMVIPYKAQKKVNRRLIRFAKRHELKTIITCDCHYLKKSDQKYHKVIMEAKGWSYDSDGLWYMNFKSIKSEFLENHLDDVFTKEVFKESIRNLGEIQEKIEDYSIDTSSKLPMISKNADKELIAACLQGLKRIGKHGDEEYENRMDQELDVIFDKGFSNYFLMCKDICDWAVERTGFIAPGRGSAAGCLVSYLIGITGVDPIPNGLLFERFLNPEREDAVDIDMDFLPSIREPMKEYLIQKYGENRVLSIGTFGFMKAKSIIGYLSRAFGIAPWEYNAATKDISSDNDYMEIEDLIVECPSVADFIDENPKIKKYYNRLMGSVSNVSTHASGIIISDTDLDDKIPIIKSGASDGGILVSSWCEGGATHELEKVGFFKFDVLGLNTLQIVKDTIDLVKERTGELLDPYDFPMDDEDAFDLSEKGEVDGIFQLEGFAVKKFIEKLKPRNLEELTASISLPRPGPVEAGLDEAYIDSRNGYEVDLPDILEEMFPLTYGVIVYEEQIMQVCREIGDFTLAESDLVRRDLKRQGLSHRRGHITREQMDENLNKLKGEFVHSAKRFMKEKEAEKLWQDMIGFAMYSFNKSHALAYTIISFWELYLKAHYPLEFMTSLLKNTPRGKETRGQNIFARYLKSARRIGLELLPPDINLSGSDITCEDDKYIRMGLFHIKGVANSAKLIEMERERGGEFTTFEDFYNRIDRRRVNKRVVRALIKAGALDDFYPEPEMVELDVTTEDQRNHLAEVYAVMRRDKEYELMEDADAEELEVLGIRLSMGLLEANKNSRNMYVSEIIRKYDGKKSMRSVDKIGIAIGYVDDFQVFGEKKYTFLLLSDDYEDGMKVPVWSWNKEKDRLKFDLKDLVGKPISFAYKVNWNNKNECTSLELMPKTIEFL